MKILCGVVILFLSTYALSAVDSSWKHQAYAYHADNASIEKVLQDFASAQGVKLNISPLSGRVNGKIRSDNLEEFLNRLAIQYRFQWFVYNGTLYVSPLSDQVAQRIEVPVSIVTDLQQALKDLGLLQERFGWGELLEEGVVLVSGPKKYVELVQQFSRENHNKHKPKEPGFKVMVFALKFASVADRRINYRGQDTVVPGVATLLRSVLESRKPKLTKELSQGDPFKNPEALFLGQSDAAASDLWTGGSQGLTNQTKSFVGAEVRNNAVLIYDDPKKRAYYQALIAKLDVVRERIEIDAIILDISRSTLSDLGMDWQVRRDGVSVAVDSFIEAGSSATLRISDFGRFITQLRALEGKGKASILANPSILTLDNQLAVIDFSKTAYLKATGERVAQFEKVTAGTSLQVIPRMITQNGESMIQMDIDIEDGSLDNSTAEMLQVSNSKISTQALVGEQRALVIGGFHVEQSGDKQRKVPLLGDVPLVGTLFSSKHKDSNKRERLFILTARVLRDIPDPVSYLSRSSQSSLDRSLTDLAQRHSGAAVQTREEISRAMSALVKGDIPIEFNVSDPALYYSLNTVCQSGHTDLQIDSQRAQWFAGPEFHLAVVVVRNEGRRTRRFNEANCASDWTLAVSAWPVVDIKPGQEIEVFIALRPRHALDKPERPSLINQTALNP